MNKRKKLGDAAEQLIANTLIKDGFTILEQNYRTRLGEVDIIAGKDDILAFVEVKMRTTIMFDLSTVITKSKQRKIIRAAKEYLIKNDYYDTKVCRFDVALVQGLNAKNITYFPNAFTE